MKRKPSVGKLPSYKNPPVTEVVVGVVFQEAIQGFLMPHIGLFWNRVVADFPETSHAAPFTPTGAEPRWLDPITGLPLPRAWFISRAKTDLLQLQGDCFFFNWRKVGDTEYPRFDYVMRGFERYLAVLLEFLTHQGLPQPKPAYCELTYTNNIAEGVAWKSMKDVEGIIKDFRWTNAERFFSTPRGVSWTAQFDLRDEAGTLSARFSQVRRVPDMARSLRLDLTARGLNKASTMDGIRPWYDIAHEAIVLGFTDLTTGVAQKELWQRDDG